MAKQTVIQDVCNVVIEDLDGNVAANTYLQMSALEGTISEEDLRAGIGNGKIFKIRSDKDLNLNFRSAVFDADWLALTQGVEVVDKTATITRAERLPIHTEGGDLVVTIEGNPDNDEVKVTDNDGTAHDLTATDGKITIDPAFGLVDGDDVLVSYKETVEGSGIEFDSAKFSKKYKVTMSTIAYDLNTGEVYSDIHFVFPEALPGGDFSFSFEAGTVITPEITFSILQKRGSTVMGEMVEVPRKKKSATPPTPGVTKPATPTGLSLTPGDEEVLVGWTEVADADTYTIYVNDVNGVENERILDNLTGDSHTVTGLTNNNEYEFEISATNSAGESGKSSVEKTTPTP